MIKLRNVHVPTAMTSRPAALAVSARGLAAKPTALGGAIAPSAFGASHLAAAAVPGAVALHAGSGLATTAAPSMASLSAVKIANPSVLKTLTASEMAKVEPLLHPLYHQVEVGSFKGIAEMLHVDRASLSDDVETRVAQLAKFLTHDAIGRDTQVGWYNGMGGGNMPNTELVFTTPGSTTVNAKVKLTKPFGYEKDMSTFEVKAADLGPGGTLHAKMLFPTSGHNGFDNAITWASRDGAPYNVSLGFDGSTTGSVSPQTTASMAFELNPKGYVKYPTDTKIVTVSDVTFRGLTKGEHRLYTWPDPTGVGGAPEERTLIINVI